MLRDNISKFLSMFWFCLSTNINRLYESILH